MNTQLKGKRILITGASGFIGTNLSEHFRTQKYIVLNLDNHAPKNADYSAYWRQVDILDIDVLRAESLSFNPDYIIHLAARTDLNGKTINDYKANTTGTENILKIAGQLSNLKKIIVTSSMLVCCLGYTPKDCFDYHPTTLYGESKVITEKMVWQNKPVCDWAIIRPTSIWGEWFGEPYRNFFDMVTAKRYFHIGKKSCTKTYGYVKNSVYQIEKILFADTRDESGKVFYIGDYEPTNIEKWADEIAAKLKYKILRLPWLLVYLAALAGDLLKIFNIKFPMTTFRLHNMTTDNVIDLSNTRSIAPVLPYTRIQGITRTLDWMNIKN